MPTHPTVLRFSTRFAGIEADKWMRRADRLFQIVQFLRSRRLTTAAWLAARFEVSIRTIYRDMDDLLASGVPIEGEAGVGYVLRRKLDLPPLMFDRNELISVELGLKFVQAYTGHPLATAAAQALAKVRNALPEAPPQALTRTPVFVPRPPSGPSPHVAPLTLAIDGRRKIYFKYRDVAGERTTRRGWPLGIFFWGNAWTVLSWCELREDFRTFRLDRVEEVTVLADRFPDQSGRRLADYLRRMEHEHAVSPDEFDSDA